MLGKISQREVFFVDKLNFNIVFIVKISCNIILRGHHFLITPFKTLKSQKSSKWSKNKLNGGNLRKK